MSKQVTLRDIGEQLGLSASTISRALSGDVRVAAATRRRVKAVCDEMGYRPNVIARSLRTKKTKMILLVVRDIKNPFYLDVMAGVETAARAAGYNVLMCNCEDKMALISDYVDMLQDRRADGMILMTGKLSEELQQQVAAESLPIVVALEMIENCALPHVQIDNIAAGVQAVNHLIGLGHERIAYISGPDGEVMSARRRIGYRQAMQAANLAILPGYEQQGTFELHSADEACRHLMSLPTPPTAIFFANDEMALGAIKLLTQMGYRVPEDVSVVGFDNLFWGEVSQPSLTTIDQPRLLVGQEAFRILLATINGQQPKHTIVLPTELCIRESTTAPKQ